MGERESSLGRILRILRTEGSMFHTIPCGCEIKCPWYGPCAGSIADEMMSFFWNLTAKMMQTAQGTFYLTTRSVTPYPRVTHTHKKKAKGTCCLTTRDILSHYKVSTHTHKKAQSESPTHTKKAKGTCCLITR
jgi:hypothetical protein